MSERVGAAKTESSQRCPGFLTGFQGESPTLSLRPWSLIKTTKQGDIQDLRRKFCGGIWGVFIQKCCVQMSSMSKEKNFYYIIQGKNSDFDEKTVISGHSTIVQAQIGHSTIVQAHIKPQYHICMVILPYHRTIPQDHTHLTPRALAPPGPGLCLCAYGRSQNHSTIGQDIFKFILPVACSS